MASEKYLLSDGLANLNFTAEHVERFRQVGTQMEVPKNFMLFEAGDVPNCCYYIEEGRVAAFEYTASGGEHVFTVNGAGAMILVPSMVITHELSLNFRTITSSRLICIERDALNHMILEEPDMAADFIYSLSSRLIHTIEQFRQRGNYSVPWRVCNYLLFLADQSGIDYDGKTMIQEKISQQEIANMLQANRVTVARAIKDLKDLGLMEYINGFYCIRSIDKIKKHMNYLELLAPSK